MKIAKKRNILLCNMVAALLLYSLCFFSPQLYAADLQLNTGYTQQLLTEAQMLMHRVVLDKPGVLVLNCSPQASLTEHSYWKVRLSDSKMQVVAEVLVRGDRAETQSSRLRLPPGIYDLRLTAGERFSNAELDIFLAFTDESDLSAEREPNDSLAGATALQINKVMLGNTQRSDDIDYYFVRIEKEGFLSVRLEADRVSAGSHWQLGLYRENQELQTLQLDALLHSTSDIEVTPGKYYLRVASLEDALSDEDYRLVVRFNAREAALVADPIPDPISDPPLLATGQFVQSRIAVGASAVEYRFVFTPHDLSTDTLALRLRDLQAKQGSLLLELYDAGERMLWQSAVTAPEIYAALIPHLHQGEYLLRLTLAEETSDDVDFEIGLFYPDDLVLQIGLQIATSQMTVNDEMRDIDPGYATTPVLVSGRTLLPIRSMVQVFGGEIAWDEEKQQVSISCGGRYIDLWIGAERAVVDGLEVELSAAPQIIAGRTMLPLRFVAEALGCFVRWQPEDQRIYVSY